MSDALDVAVRELEAEKDDLRKDLKLAEQRVWGETAQVCDLLDNQCHSCEERWMAQDKEPRIIVEEHLLTAWRGIHPDGRAEEARWRSMCYDAPDPHDQVNYAEQFYSVAQAKRAVEQFSVSIDGRRSRLVGGLAGGRACAEEGL